ncbi:hypothetical protein C448_02823 [Halococcus morrhuae DSM 1307]|uniref:Uncharacterized protein n=1 Tax=Halococcus morrhuae DSM 1307 TaxID=931277 RepID=M0MSQ2_HALMO|nr:hypothetical protein C448_02823 [Halococcus morrhuae DSM 1307]
MKIQTLKKRLIAQRWHMGFSLGHKRRKKLLRKYYQIIFQEDKLKTAMVILKTDKIETNIDNLHTSPDLIIYRASKQRTSAVLLARGHPSRA